MEELTRFEGRRALRHHRAGNHRRYLLNFTPIDPLKALVLSAQTNGVIAVPIMTVMMMIVHNQKLMGEFTLSRRHTITTWLGVAMVLVAVVAMFATMRGITPNPRWTQEKQMTKDAYRLDRLIKLPIEWSETGDVDFPYRTQIMNVVLQIRLNDFPDERLFSLIQDGEHVIDFDDWPPEWKR